MKKLMIALFILTMVIASCTKDDAFYVEQTNYVVCPIDTTLYKPIQGNSINN
jgi:hypothetical protein